MNTVIYSPLRACYCVTDNIIIIPCLCIIFFLSDNSWSATFQETSLISIRKAEVKRNKESDNYFPLAWFTCNCIISKPDCITRFRNSNLKYSFLLSGFSFKFHTYHDSTVLMIQGISLPSSWMLTDVLGSTPWAAVTIILCPVKI